MLKTMRLWQKSQGSSEFLNSNVWRARQAQKFMKQAEGNWRVGNESRGWDNI